MSPVCAGRLFVALIASGLMISLSLAACSSRNGSSESALASKRASGPAIPLPTMTDTAPRDYAGLHNVVAYHDQYYSGSVPEGDAGFETLAAMGVKTIISVDGAMPDVEAAKARGIRYIHLPIGYNGFDERRKLELTRATRDSMERGPVYIHCHHGKHRSAGAAAAAVASLGWSTPDTAVERMRVSGTSPTYKGLYACAANASVLSPRALESVGPDFPEISRPSGYVAGMIEIDEINEHLRAIQKAGWTTPKDHPDLVPVAEAGRMADLFRILNEGELVKSHSADFAEMMVKNSDQAQALEDMLAAGESDTLKLSAQFKLIEATCKECHVKYRD